MNCPNCNSKLVARYSDFHCISCDDYNYISPERNQYSFYVKINDIIYNILGNEKFNETTVYFIQILYHKTLYKFKYKPLNISMDLKPQLEDIISKALSLKMFE